ncbi:hypothetical protein [Curtobacterium sp. UNCCL17]|uniref:hypothetical protein n=1 Tax=Curtobacterium sp. UNCCL17 TaxID=1449051 RepID=UPI000484E5E3|nr:hypothetical protein [Curtobacterium sp. UNCCL17]
MGLAAQLMPVQAPAVAREPLDAPTNSPHATVGKDLLDPQSQFVADLPLLLERRGERNGTDIDAALKVRSLHAELSGSDLLERSFPPAPCSIDFPGAICGNEGGSFCQFVTRKLVSFTGKRSVWVGSRPRHRISTQSMLSTRLSQIKNPILLTLPVEVCNMYDPHKGLCPVGDPLRIQSGAPIE